MHDFQFLVAYSFTAFLSLVHTLETYYLPFYTTLDLLHALAATQTEMAYHVVHAVIEQVVGFAD